MKAVEPTASLHMYEMLNDKFASKGLLSEREILISNLEKKGNLIILTAVEGNLYKQLHDSLDFNIKIVKFDILSEIF